MSVPIGDVLGMMTALIVGFVNLIVILLMALIAAKSNRPLARIAVTSQKSTI